MSRVRALSALFVAAIVGVLVLLIPGTANATYGMGLTVDCVSKNPDGTFNAIFGYDNSLGTDVDLGRGSNFSFHNGTATNIVTPSKFNGSQPSYFYQGSKRAAFVVKFGASESVTWTVSYDDRHPHGTDYYSSVTASKNSKACAVGPELPGAGNGSGQLIVVGVSSLIVGAAYLFRRRRSVN